MPKAIGMMVGCPSKYNLPNERYLNQGCVLKEDEYKTIYPSCST